jgi:hypothetical protein
MWTTTQQRSLCIANPTTTRATRARMMTRSHTSPTGGRVVLGIVLAEQVNRV